MLTLCMLVYLAGDSKLRFDQIDEIEVVGSATRSPLITNALRDFLGKEPKRTMNSEEAVAKGCALRAAMISPNFRVREFSILDSCPYAIALSWSSAQQVSGALANLDLCAQSFMRRVCVSECVTAHTSRLCCRHVHMLCSDLVMKPRMLFVTKKSHFSPCLPVRAPC